jgi:hypothetical protein
MLPIHEHIDKATLGVLPNPLKLARALMRSAQPFVMINMLSFKPQATGDYAHLSGQEAYELYAQSVQEAQAPLGSRLLWSGQVQHKMTVGNAPSFHSIAFLEYASPIAFLQFVTKGGSNTKARSAGLHGQWLIASTTLDEGKLPDPDDAHVILIEFGGGTRQNSEAGEGWQEVWKSAYRDVGGLTLWHGRCDHHIIGTSIPGVEDVITTWFPNARVLEQGMKDLKRSDHLKKLQPYVTYTAHSMTGFLPDLS